MYIMAVSPWYYTNQLEFEGQNQSWKGDVLWDLRCKF